MREVGRAAQKPPGFDDLIAAFLAAPTTAAGDAFINSLVDFMQLQQYDPGFISRFVMDTEWAWCYGQGPVEDW